MKKIVFLVSGSGGSLKFLHSALERMNINAKIIGILSDRNCLALDFANQKKIYSKQIKYNQNYVIELQDELDFLNPDLIITNIHKIIDEGTLNRFPDKFINLHYSLLPSYKGYIGMKTVLKAKEDNVGFIGGTCHLVNKEVDGGKIIQQGCFSVDWNNVDNVIDTVFKTSCLCLLEGAIGRLGLDKEVGREQLVFNNSIVYFSPKLSVGDFNFDDSFWSLINNNESLIF